MKPEKAKAILAELDNLGLNAPFGAIAELSYSGAVYQWINADTCEYHHSEDLRTIVEQAERIEAIEKLIESEMNSTSYDMVASAMARLLDLWR